MADWRAMGAAALGRGIAAGRIDPRALTEAYLAAIAGEDPDGQVYARLTPERARDEAAAAAVRAAGGRLSGPLDGVPISWKDNIDTAGVATEAGTRLLAGRVPEADAPVLAAATAAGLVCLGKTHLSEIAFSGLGHNPITATPPNALDAARVPGGSSSGAAVSTARGLAAAGIGTDTGGSVRIPAAWNGLVGLKTSVGRLPTLGVVPLAPSLDTVGPLARSVEDAGLLFRAMAGEAERPLPEAVRPAALLVPQALVVEDVDADPRAAFEAALDRLARAGLAPARTAAPEITEAFRTVAEVSPLVTSEAWDVWGARIAAAPGVVDPRIEARVRLGEGASPEADARARQVYRRLGASLAARIEAEGPLAMPSVASLPPRTDAIVADEIAYTAANLRALRNTRLANLLGLSAITLPLPEPMTGLMLLDGPDREDRLIAHALWIEARLAG